MPDCLARRRTPGALVVLIGCTKAKHGGPGDVLPAVTLYRASPLFRASLAYARRPAAIWVLSARYGLVGLHERVPHYQFCLADQPAAYREVWARQVAARFAAAHPCPGRAVFLVGAAYTDPLRPLLEAAGWTVAEPLRGLSIGQRLRWLRQPARGDPV
jgi:hypothetical protein